MLALVDCRTEWAMYPCIIVVSPLSMSLVSVVVGKTRSDGGQTKLIGICGNNHSCSQMTRDIFVLATRTVSPTDPTCHNGSCRLCRCHLVTSHLYNSLQGGMVEVSTTSRRRDGLLSRQRRKALCFQISIFFFIGYVMFTMLFHGHFAGTDLFNAEIDPTKAFRHPSGEDLCVVGFSVSWLFLSLARLFVCSFES